MFDESKIESAVSKEGLLTVNEQFETFCNPEDLALFYRSKLSEYETEHTTIYAKLKDQLKIIDHQYELEFSLRQKSDEINELQKSLSQMQILLFQEREHVLHLFAENDVLKIKVLRDRKELHSVLKHDSQIETKQDVDIVIKSLQLQVNALEEQLKSQRKLASIEIETLLKEREVCQIEKDAEKQEHSKKISELTLRLRDTQSMLSKNTEEFLLLKSEFRAKEETWAKEKIQIFQKNQATNKCQINDFGPSVKIQQTINGKNNILLDKLKKINKETQFYKEKCSILLKKFNSVCSEKENNEALMSKQLKQYQELLQQATSRCFKLEQRRNHENEGFKTDIINLKSQLRYIEKQIYQMIIGNDSRVEGLQVLTNLKDNVSKSIKVSDDLLELKRKMYHLEKELEKM